MSNMFELNSICVILFIDMIESKKQNTKSIFLILYEVLLGLLFITPIFLCAISDFIFNKSESQNKTISKYDYYDESLLEASNLDVIIEKSNSVDYTYDEYIDFIYVSLQQAYINLNSDYFNDIDLIVPISVYVYTSYDDTDLFRDTENKYDYSTLQGSTKCFMLDNISLRINLVEDDEIPYYIFLHTVTHELVHYYQCRNINYNANSEYNWFIEGMAEFYSYKHIPNDVKINFLKNEIKSEDIPKNIKKVNDAFDLDVENNEVFNAYTISFKYYTYLVNNYGEENIFNLMYDESKFETNFVNLTSYDYNSVYLEFINNL